MSENTRCGLLVAHYGLWAMGVGLCVLGWIMRDASDLAALNAYSLASSSLAFALLAGQIAKVQP